MNDTKKKTKVVIIVFFIILVTIVVGGFFLIKKGIFLSNIRKETITAENYEEIFNRISDELKDTDDIYYLSYSVMYYMIRTCVCQQETPKKSNIFSQQVFDF